MITVTFYKTYPTADLRISIHSSEGGQRQRSLSPAEANYHSMEGLTAPLEGEALGMLSHHFQWWFEIVAE